MRKQLLLFCFLFCSLKAYSQQDLTSPQYELKIRSEEYPVFSQAVFNGIYRYNSETAYKTKVSRNEDGSLICEISIENKGTVNTIKYFLSEYVMNLIPAGQSGNIGNDIRWKISVAKSISNKLDQSLIDPIRATITLNGYIQTDGEDFYLTSPTRGNLLLTDFDDLDITNYIDQEVTLMGWINEDQSISINEIYLIDDNTLEVYIMSLCPYGLNSVSSIFSHLDYTGNQDVSLEVKYIFDLKDGQYASLHGEQEIIENLVQMIIRDQYKSFYAEYMILRSNELRSDWNILAKKCGLSEKQIKSITKMINDDRDFLINAEYDNNRKFDASPSFVWKGEEVLFLQHIQDFSDLQFKQDGSCQ